MDIMQIIGLLAPAILTIIVQLLKKLTAIHGVVALAVVFVLGGLGAVSGLGPSGAEGFIDKTIDAGYIIGVSTFVYSLFKRQK